MLIAFLQEDKQYSVRTLLPEEAVQPTLHD